MSRRVICALIVLVAMVSHVPLGFGQTPSATSTVALPIDKNFEITPSEHWTDTAIDLHPGDLLQVSATPQGTGDKLCDPQGLDKPPGAEKLPIPNVAPAALIAKLESTGAPVFLGASRRLKITEAGRLYLGSNIAATPSCKGKYAVAVHVSPGGGSEVSSIKSKLGAAAQIWLSGQVGAAQQSPVDAAAIKGIGGGAVPITATPSASAVKPLAASNAPLDASLSENLQALPRRVNDEFKNAGDMANFILIGSLKAVQDSLNDANWHVADTSTPGALAKAIMMATQKQDYLQMPMSQLYMFGRVQDYGYEQAEPYAMVASRHHFRIWKAPFTYQEQEVWVGAGTHDIGFEKDQRNGKVTHKIDPAVDGERDHIGQSLQEAGHVRRMTYFAPSNPVQDARNATGGGYQSDGRILVLFLQ